MSSPNGERVAEEVRNTVRSGKLINYQTIQKKVGYSVKSAKAMKGTKNEGFIKQKKNIIKDLEAERDAIVEEMKQKRGKAGYSDLVRGLDVTIKNIQLLGGKPTEVLTIKDELRDKAGEALDNYLDENTKTDIE